MYHLERANPTSSIAWLAISILLLLLSGCQLEDIPTLNVKVDNNPLVLRAGEETVVRLQNVSKEGLRWEVLVKAKEISETTDITEPLTHSNQTTPAWVTVTPSQGELAAAKRQLLKLKVSEDITNLPREAVVTIHVIRAPSADVSFGVRIETPAKE